MSRIASDEPELPWEFDEAVPVTEQDAPIGRAQPFRWRDHPGKIVLAAPFLAAVLTVSVTAVVPVAVTWGFIPATAKNPTSFAVFIANWVLAIAGACAGGLLVRGRTDERVEAAVGACLVAAVGYILAIFAVAFVVYSVFDFVRLLFLAIVSQVGSG